MLLDGIVPVILCGGSGTRLWPLSRKHYPKQLLPLVDEKSMLQNTFTRVQNVINRASPLVFCNQEYRFMVAEEMQAAGFGHGDIFLEPQGRNTAPAITIAAMHLVKQGQDPLLFVMPADHVIEEMDKLAASLKAGAALANQDYLVTFGIQPTKPETGYGYILRAKALAGEQAYEVQQFVEKPSLEKAQSYLDQGDYYWNSGMFLFKASAFLKAMQEQAADIYTACEKALEAVSKDLDFYRLNDVFNQVRSESIDYAVMEKAANIAVVPLAANWSDVGSWNVLWEISPKNQDGNVTRGTVFTEKTSNSYLRADQRLLAVVGLSNVVVVETPDAILVADKNNCQDIRAMVNQLSEAKREEADAHQLVHRPWGYYDSLSKSDRYQVKHIVVKPGAKLSLQMHHHRAEHWVVIKGRATVTCGDQEFEVLENQSVYIPQGAKHRMENKTKEPLHFIEVQTGTYFGEDDIVRFDDIYGRQGSAA